MAKAHALLIGLNAVNPDHYNGWEGLLRVAEADVKSMRELAFEAGFGSINTLTGSDATRENVLDKLQHLSEDAQSGDLVLVFYSGHGGQVGDENEDELDFYDETWCLYNGQLLDDELWLAWSRFKAGVRIFLVSDSCHSGTVARPNNPEELAKEATAIEQGAKCFPVKKAMEVYKSNLVYYESIGRPLPVIDPESIKANVLSLSACLDKEYAYQGLFNSIFTEKLLKVWNKGQFEGNYQSFFEQIKQQTGTRQTPLLGDYGTKDLAFAQSKPFSFEAGSMAETSESDPANTDIQANNSPESQGALQPADLLISFDNGIAYEVSTVVDAEAFKGADDGGTNWDRAHALFEQLQSQGKPVRFVEPDYGSRTSLQKIQEEAKGPQVFLPTWPHPQVQPLDYIWHLQSGYSQLAKARNEVMRESGLNKKIRIAHLDTGFYPFQAFMPEKLLVPLAKSFVPGESENLGVDYQKSGLLPAQQGHGAATLCLLAGPKVDSPPGLPGFNDYLGGIPFAEIITIRIQDSVALLKTRAFERAVYYAIEQGCEVIAMSMAGAPSKRWAEAINYAYERGVTVVSSAGNSWRKGIAKVLPESVLYPARFDRVIAATGIAHNLQPYVFEANDWLGDSKSIDSNDMQGNWGPDSEMHHAIAAFTPNVMWAETGEEATPPSQPYFSMKGGGTSSSTPQIAAAVALWIVKHRKALKDKDYAGTWRQVEAVRYALFKSAAAPPNPAHTRYLGKGVLRAWDMLQVPPPSKSKLKQSDKATVPLLPLLSLLLGSKAEGTAAASSQSLFSDPQIEMLALELGQLAVETPELFFILENDSPADEALLEKIRSACKGNNKVSEVLRKVLKPE